MTTPVPGPNPASRLFGYAVPPDGGPAIGPDQYWPEPAHVSYDQVMSGLNPLQHLPGVGTIYRAITGDDCPAPIKIAGSLLTGAIFGGPLGALGTIVLSLAQELIRLGPDTSGPQVPAGMTVAGSDNGVQPPDHPAVGAAEPQPIMLASEWQRTQFLEHGFA